MYINMLRWSDLRYVMKFGEFWAVLAAVAAVAFLLGLAAR